MSSCEAWFLPWKQNWGRLHCPMWVLTRRLQPDCLQPLGQSGNNRKQEGKCRLVINFTLNTSNETNHPEGYNSWLRDTLSRRKNVKMEKGLSKTPFANFGKVSRCLRTFLSHSKKFATYMFKTREGGGQRPFEQCSKKLHYWYMMASLSMIY